MEKLMTHPVECRKCGHIEDAQHCTSNTCGNKDCRAHLTTPCPSGCGHDIMVSLAYPHYSRSSSSCPYCYNNGVDAGPSMLKIPLTT